MVALKRYIHGIVDNSQAALVDRSDEIYLTADSLAVPIVMETLNAPSLPLFLSHFSPSSFPFS